MEDIWEGARKFCQLKERGPMKERGPGRGYDISLQEILYFSKKLVRQSASLQHFESICQMQPFTFSHHI